VRRGKTFDRSIHRIQPLTQLIYANKRVTMLANDPNQQPCKERNHHPR
jgi:hypothetical protein